MFDSSRRQPLNNDLAGTEAAPAHQRRQVGESAEGWVVAEITPYPRPLRLLPHSNVNGGANGFTPAGGLAGKLLENFFAAQYAPPAAQFVLAVVPVEGEPVKRGRLRWADIQIVLRSPREWPVQVQESDAPWETPELRLLVEELAAEARRQGWEPAGRGRTWCSLRFRRQG